MRHVDENVKIKSVIYIGGYGRSGSTLLDVILGNHPAIFGAGELTHAFCNMDSNSTCSCGLSVSKCNLWGGVRKRILQELPGISFSTLNLITRELEDVISGSDRQSIYFYAWRAMAKAIFEESGAHFLVDSSKSTWKVARRLKLIKQAGLEVRCLHLVRNPKAVIWSIHRGSNRLLEQGKNARLFGGMIRGLLGWIFSNLLFEMYRRKIGQPFIRIRYEDMVGDPIAEIIRIGLWLGTDMGPVIHRLTNNASLSPGHGISGNRMRRQGAIRIKEDKQWQKATSCYARLLALLTYPLARRYGYKLRSGSNGL